MATLPPLSLRKQKNPAKNAISVEIPENFTSVLCRFKGLDGNSTIPSTLVPGNISLEDLRKLLNKLLNNVRYSAFSRNLYNLKRTSQYHTYFQQR